MKLLIKLWSVTFLLFGCSNMQAKAPIISFIFKNESSRYLDWVRLDGAKVNPIGGVMRPGISKVNLSMPWHYEESVVVTFVDEKTRERYRIKIDCSLVNAKIKAGKCLGIVLEIQDYDKAIVRCEDSNK